MIKDLFRHHVQANSGQIINGQVTYLASVNILWGAETTLPDGRQVQHDFGAGLKQKEQPPMEAALFILDFDNWLFPATA